LDTGAVIGVILAITDTVSVIAVFKEVPVPSGSPPLRGRKLIQRWCGSGFVQPDFESQCDWLTQFWMGSKNVVLQAVPWWG